MTTIFTLRPKSLKNTQNLEWEFIIPPGYESYNIESITGFIFNQCFIRQEDKLKIDINLYPVLEYEAGNSPGNFGGFFHELPSFELYETDDFIYADDKENDFLIENGECCKYMRTDNGWEKEEIHVYSYCGIEDDESVLSVLITPKNGDYFYNTTTSTVWLYDEDIDAFYDSESEFKITALRRLYESLYITDSHSIQGPEITLYELHEIRKVPDIIITPWDKLFNEYLRPDAGITIQKFAHQPDVCAIVETIDSAFFNRPLEADETRWYFHTSSAEGDDIEIKGLPLTFNSTVSTVNRGKETLPNNIGVANLNASSIPDLVTDCLNLHLACFLYNYWIRSDNTISAKLSSMYYRMIDVLKFASQEKNYLANYLTCLHFVPDGSGGIYQELITGYGEYKSEKENANRVYNGAIALTESLKLGGETRMLYPTSVVNFPFLTFPIFEREFNKHTWPATYNIYSEEVYEKILSLYYEDPFRVFATDQLSTLLFSRKIGYEDGTEVYEHNGVECLMNLVEEGIYKKREFAVSAQSFGFFSLFSPYLYVTSSEPTQMDLRLNLDERTNDEDTFYNDTGIVNCCFKFTQTSMGFNWLSNSLPLGKIPIDTQRKIIFKLVNAFGFPIPLVDSSSGLNIQALLEIYAHKTTVEK